jgi:RimJ/RimL family protein N-acetyltransferase
MSSTPIFPAYRVHTRRALLRCWEPVDAPMLTRVIEANLDHLTPWMPWIKEEPEPVEEKAARLRRFRAEFDLDQNYIYGVFTPEGSEVLGGTGLHARVGPRAFEIGYWIDVGHINQGLATEVAAALTRAAFELHRVDRVEIRCEPENGASAAVPRKLGFTHEGNLRRRLLGSGDQLRDTMVWSLFADGYAASPAASAELQAFDVLGRRIL